MSRENRTIRICSGAGCKAWDSESMARQLEGQAGGNVRVCRVACMKKCGGGFNVLDSTRQQVVKIRQPEEALRLFNLQEPQVAMA